MEGQPALEVAGLSQRLGGQKVLQGLSFAMAQGQFFALIGPSGSGKTTLLRLIAGLDQPIAGEIRLQGQNATSLPPERRGVAMVFQQPLLFPHLTVAANVGFGLKVRGTPVPDLQRLVQEALALVHMEEMAQRYPSQISGGQQQRVSLARALVVRPRVLLLDEPFSHLDPGLRAEMRALLQSLQRRTHITALLVTHDHDEALQLGDRMGVLLDGHLVQVERPHILLAEPASRAVASFMQAGNLLPGKIEGGRFVSDFGTGPLPTRGAPWRDGLAWAVVPPADLRIEPPGQGPSGLVEQIYPTLHGHLAKIEAAGEILSVRMGRAGQESGFSPGGRVSLRWDTAACWYVRE